MRQRIQQQEIISRLEGDELQFYMKKYTQLAKTIDYETHLALIDLLNAQLDALAQQASHKQRNKKEPIQAALSTIERLFVEKYPENIPLAEQLPQWYA